MTQHEPQSPGPDDLETRLRRSLHGDLPQHDTEGFLTDVHRGARRRRQRRVTGGVLATAAVIVVGAYGVTSAGIFDTDATTAADRDPTPTVFTPEPSGNATPTPESTSASPTSGEAVRALSLSATGTDHQYVLMAGRFGCRGDCLTAYTTPDGGRSWADTAAIGLRPADPDPTTKTAYAIRFADEQNGWVFGGGLRSTHDGGGSWSKPSLPAGGIVSALEARGDWVYASVYDDAAASSTVVRSPIDQDSWETVDVGVSLNLVTEMAVSSRLVAVLASPTFVSADNQILASPDAGTTWNQISPCPLGSSPSSVSTSATALWTLCSGQQTSRAWVTTNQGDTWSRAPGTFSPGGLIQARDDSTAVVADSGRPGIALVTVSGAPQRTLSNQGDLLTIGFTNTTTGYLRTMDDRILRTVDSGATWQPYPLP